MGSVWSSSKKKKSNAGDAPLTTRPPPGATGTVYLAIRPSGVPSFENVEHFALYTFNANAAEDEQWQPLELTTQSPMSPRRLSSTLTF